jgi:hypothetical protein
LLLAFSLTSLLLLVVAVVVLQ